MKNTLFILFIAFSGIIILSSCFRNEFPYEDTGELQFSLDTLTFDTVFTTIGSATRSFKVINGSNQPISISRVTLGGGEASNFRLNVDGVSTQTFVESVEIPAEDSIYIFAEVTIDPNNDQTPFVITDEVRFDFNGNEQVVTLEAWGQNAIYLGTKGGLGVLDCSSNPVWTSDLPYVIYGILFLEGGTLTLDKGTKVHLHGSLINADSFFYNDGIIFVLENASLDINGTLDEPVVIEGDRLESDFDEEPGQWAGILLGSGSKGNHFNYAHIKNSIVGVRVDSLAELDIENSIINNTLSSNLLGYHAGKIQAENCLFFSSSGGNNVQLEFGGDYDFRHCTMASYSSVYRISHSSPVVRMSNFLCTSGELGCPDYIINPMNANFQNCIIYGSRPNEIAISEKEEGSGFFNYTLDHCLIRLDSAETFNVPILTTCQNCVVNSDPNFVNIDQLNYQLDTLSPAATMGKSGLQSILNGGVITQDIIQNSRNTNPSVGCYEYRE
jgi:hypothetical protein